MRHERYESNRALRLGFRVWGEMFARLWESRELMGWLFIRNFSAKYKQALFGVAWTVVVPLVAIGTFILLRKAGAFVTGPTDIPYPLFALAGLAVFQLFSTGTASASSSLVEAGDMIAKVNFPREVLVIAGIAQSIVEFLVKIILIVGLCIWYGYTPSMGIFFLPLVLLPLIFLTLGVGLVLSLVAAVFRDTIQAVMILMTFLMLLTPVFYPTPAAWDFYFRLNPLTALIEAPRDLFIYGYLRHPVDFVVVSVLSVLVFACAWRIFYLVETKIPERI